MKVYILGLVGVYPMDNKKGLTLIELVIVLALIGILSSLLFFPILFSFDNFQKQSNTVNEISIARSTMELLTKEIRKASIINVENNSLILDSVIYKLEEGALEKNGQVLFSDINALNFVKEETIIKDETKEKIITRISIQIKIEKDNREMYELSSIVVLR